MSWPFFIFDARCASNCSLGEIYIPADRHSTLIGDFKQFKI